MPGIPSRPRPSEYLLGNLPITMLPSLVALAPLYGGGALLIRELTRRAGRGVPTMLVLGIAYGLVEEGVTTQSLFNPDYANSHLLDDGFIPALGIAGPWTLFVLSLHAIWSTTASIVVAEACAPSRRTEPWLRTPGLVVTGVLFVMGSIGDLVKHRLREMERETGVLRVTRLRPAARSRPPPGERAPHPAQRRRSGAAGTPRPPAAPRAPRPPPSVRGAGRTGTATG